MAKLNKSEINAVANKIYNLLKKSAEQKRQDAIKNYNASDFYNECVYLSIKRNDLEKELDKIKDSLYTLGKDFGSWGGFLHDSTEEIKQKIINRECKLQELPTIEELQDDVIIASIDKNFNVDTFIENFIKKFN